MFPVYERRWSAPEERNLTKYQIAVLGAEAIKSFIPAHADLKMI